MANNLTVRDSKVGAPAARCAAGAISTANWVKQAPAPEQPRARRSSRAETVYYAPEPTYYEALPAPSSAPELNLKAVLITAAIFLVPMLLAALLAGGH
jgi:hypothetical protein